MEIKNQMYQENVHCTSLNRGADTISYSIEKHKFQGAQWVRDQGMVGSSLTSVSALCPRARHINPCLVLVPSMSMKTAL